MAPPGQGDRTLPPMSERLTLYATRLLRDPEGLPSSLDSPFLVFEPPMDEDAATSGDEDDYRFRTASGVSIPTLGSAEALVFPVKKVADNAFKRGVTVGRTTNNDVVLDDGSVSRFHAWLIHDAESGRWTLTDSGSKNGTAVNGTPLKPKVPMPLGDRAKIRFGQVEVTFYSPAAFVELLKRRMNRG